MKKLTEKFVVAGFGLALLLLSSVGAASYWSVQKLNEDKQWVTHTNQILNILDDLNQGFLNAESEQRGYRCLPIHSGCAIDERLLASSSGVTTRVVGWKLSVVGDKPDNYRN